MKKYKLIKMGLGVLVASSAFIANANVSANDEVKPVDAGGVVTQLAIAPRVTGEVFWDDENVLEYVVTAADEVEVKKLNDDAVRNGDGKIVITIPDTITNSGTTYKVTSVGASAMTSVGQVPKYGVVIGNNVRDIKDKAFSSESLSGEIKLPASVRTVGKLAFALSDYNNVVLNEGLISIGEEAFYRSNIVGNITIPNSVTSIGVSAFQYNKITSVTLGSGLTVIPKDVFKWNEITSVNFDSGITEFAVSAFHSNNITNLDLSQLKNLKKINHMAFGGNPLEEVILPQGLELIGFGPFNGSGMMKKLIIPASVTSIGVAAFADSVEHLYFEGDGSNLKIGVMGQVPGLDTDFSSVLFPDTTESIYVPSAAAIPNFKKLFNKVTVASYEDTGNNGVETWTQIPQDRVVLEIKADYFGYAANTPATISKRKGESTSIEAINGMTSFGKWNTTRQAWDDQLVNLHEGEKPVQWYKDGNAIAGQTAAVLNINNITNADAGKYYAMASGVKLSEITLFVNESEMISADNFSLTLDEAENLSEADAIAFANAKAWDEDDNTPITIASVDIAKVKAEQGVYDVTFATAKGKSVTVKAVVGENVAYYDVDGKDVTMTVGEYKTQVSKGTLEEYILKKSNAKGTKRDLNGVYDVPVSADISTLKDLKVGDKVNVVINADTTSSDPATIQVVENSKQITVKIVDSKEKSASISTGDQTNTMQLITFLLLSGGAFIVMNKYRKETE